MTTPQTRSWQAVRREALRRIRSREWQPGALIPNEAELAREFQCTRTTVNRALRALAEAGLLDRRRRAGTRVALHPVRTATLRIPVIRREIEGRGLVCGYALLSRRRRRPPAALRERMRLPHGVSALHLTALYTADAAPYAFEDRWINPATVPDALTADFRALSANEWLLANAPFSHGTLMFSAAAATPREADALGTATGAALFVLERDTWSGERSITSLRLSYAPGYRLGTAI